ncbi:MAG: aldehyde ferredoxin oxidoreductase family protein [Desulfocucumaceae bacterium]
MYGYTGRIALVDLGTGRARQIEIGEHDYRLFIGGRGLASKLLIDLLPPGVEPLGAENVVIFSVGPFNGTLVPTASRWSVATKSPLTGLLGSGNGGGQWGAELKWAGFDAVAVTGISKNPCFLYITDGRVEVLPADDLWGKTTWETEDLIRARFGDPGVKVVSIGQAGENLVPISNVIGDKVHAGGRGGVGAILGSKRLKAIAVRGRGGVEVFDGSGLYSKVQEMLQYVSEEPAFDNYRKYGSMFAVKGRYQKMGGIPAYNFKQGTFPHLDRIDHLTFASEYDTGARSCTGCPVSCFHMYTVNREGQAGDIGAAPQAATLLGFGCRCGLLDLGAILKAQSMVDRYGLDMISTEGVIAYAMECWEKGLLKADGIPLEWGRPDAVINLINDIAMAEGLGELIGKGCRAMARELGGEAEAFAPHVKGLEMTAVDVRAVKSWGVAYAVSSRGADHMRAYSMAEFGGFPEQIMVNEAGTPDVLDLFGTAGKGRIVAFFEDIRAISDSLELCKFFARGKYALPENLSEIYKMVTGIDISPGEIRAAGERIIQTERIFNLREGLVPADDTLPKRMLNEPIPDGPAAGETLDLEPMLSEYYSARDWDSVTGYPARDKLEKLGLSGLVPEGVDCK